MNQTFVEEGEKSILKFNTNKDGLPKIFHIFAGGREGKNIDKESLFIIFMFK
jgi:hypothetical protein